MFIHQRHLPITKNATTLALKSYLEVHTRTAWMMKSMQGCRVLQGDPLPPLLSCLGTDPHLEIPISKEVTTFLGYKRDWILWVKIGMKWGKHNKGENIKLCSRGQNTIQLLHFLSLYHQECFLALFCIVQNTRNTPVSIRYK